ncbi:TP53-binding protein 1 isoform X1 [Nematostella vectensis]|uniref:TP53-binding protein 1 isoform X1 n=1 Tax=Nematostella vectensis TaxID=45351 RepID=UPI002077678D|nr:TP53-binding protein 1 isoform X1 [Nematostella vectensis]
MDFSENCDFSPPCLLVPNSQFEELEFGPHEHIKSITTSLPGLLPPSKRAAIISKNNVNDGLLTGSPQYDDVQEGAIRYAGGTGNSGGGGGNATSEKSEDAGGSSSTTGAGDQGSAGQGGGGGGTTAGSGGDGGDNHDDDDDEEEPSAYEDDTSHSENQSSSSNNSIPNLIPPGQPHEGSIPEWKYPFSDTAQQKKMNQSSCSSYQSANITSSSSESAIQSNVSTSYSQASTAVVGNDSVSELHNVSGASEELHAHNDSTASTAAADDVADVSDIHTPESTSGVQQRPLLLKKSSSSSSGVSKSSVNSSMYQASSSSSPTSLSTLSSPETRHYHLPHLQRKQLSDASSSSSSSREGCVLQRTMGTSILESLEESPEEQEVGKQEAEMSSQEDLFLSPHRQDKKDEDSKVMSSQEVSRLHTPQGRSTPVEPHLQLLKQALKQVKPHTDSGESKIVQSQGTPTSKYIRTSTPSYDGKEPLQSQGTPIAEKFSCLQFSGTVGETSESSDAVQPSPEAFSSHIIPSSPTDGQNGINDRSNANVSTTSSDEVELLSPPHYQATSLVKETSSSSSNAVNNPSPNAVQVIPDSPERKENSNEDNSDELVRLPRWQVELMRKAQAEEDKSKMTKQSSSLTSTSAPSASMGNITEENPVQQQSVDSMDYDESEPSLPAYKRPKLDHMPNKPAVETFEQQSVSPSSFVIDADDKLFKFPDKPVKKDPPLIAQQEHGGPTQPDLSEDLFQPGTSSTQESITASQVVVSKSFQQSEPSPGDEEQEMDQSQLSFSLHLTQSQAESQMPNETSPAMDIDDQQDDPSCLSALTEPITSQSILEPLVPTAHTPKHHEDTRQGIPAGSIERDEQIDKVIPPDSNPTSKIHLQGSEPSNVIPSCSNTDPKNGSNADPEMDKKSTVHINVTHSEEHNDNRRDNGEDEQQAILPTSEVSSESTSTVFHFSLPPDTEPLQPALCTTPPPLRLWQKPIELIEPEPTTQSAVESVACVTAEQTAQAPSTPQIQLSIMRQETPESDSEATQTYLHIENPVSTRPPTDNVNEPDIQPNTRAQPTSRQQETAAPLSPFAAAQSVFARKANKGTKRKKELSPVASDNPFAFTSQDDVPQEPIAKRQRDEQETTDKRRRNEPEPTDKRRRDEPPTDIHERRRYRKVTKTKTIRTVTTTVKHVVTVRTYLGESDEVASEVTFEDNEVPAVEKEVKENEEVEHFEETITAAGGSTIKPVRNKKETAKIHDTRRSPRRSTRGTALPGQDGEDRPSGEGRQSGGPGIQAVWEAGTSGVDTVPPLTRQATIPVIDEPPASHTPPHPLSAGVRVLARWSDNFFYPGEVTSGPSKAGLFNVTFDDGDKRRLRAERLIAKDVLSVGQNVLAQGEDDFFEEAVIVGHYKSGDERGYEVEDKKGCTKRYPRSKVILSEEQVAVLLTSSSSLRTTSSSSVSTSVQPPRDTSTGRSLGGSADASCRTPRDRSRENGKNHQRTKSSGKDSTCSTRGSRDTSRDTSCKDTTGSAGTRPTRQSPRKSAAKNNETPKSSRKGSRMYRERTLSRRKRDIGNSSNETSTDESPQRVKPHGARRGLGKALGQGGARNPRLFSGYSFLITSVRKEDLNDSTDSESERLELDRKELEHLITSCGGVVFNTFSKSQTAEKCFLISNTCQRTQKYFQSLAYGIPCLSHMFIHDCHTLNKIQPFRKYLLPAGRSLETGELVECGTQPRPKVLRGLRVYLHGDRVFRQTWSSVALAAGSEVVTKLPNRPSRAVEQSDDLDFNCDVIVTDTSPLSVSTRHVVSVLGIPLVTLEWLLQCLINGWVVSFDNPKYFVT